MKSAVALPAKLKANALLGTTQESEAIKKIKPELYQVCSGDLHPDRSIARDTRSRSGEYTSVQTAHNSIPTCLLALVREAALDFDQSEINSYKIQYFVGFRYTETTIDPPGANVISRVLYNVGNKEIYHLKAGGVGVKELTEMIKNKAKSNSDEKLDDKDILFPADSCVYFGYHDMCDYQITVSGRPPEKTPEYIQPGGQKLGKTMRFMRPPAYHRITVVIDLEGDAKLIKRLKEGINDRIGKMNVSELHKTAAALSQQADILSTADRHDMTISKKEQKEIRKLMSDSSPKSSVEKTTKPSEKTEKEEEEKVAAMM